MSKAKTFKLEAPVRSILEAASAVAGTVAAKSPLPAYLCILLDVSEDGVLTMVAVNPTTGVSVRARAAEASGNLTGQKILLPRDRIMRMISALPKTSIMSITVGDNEQATIAAPGSRWVVPTYQLEGFREPAPFEEKAYIQVEAGELADAIKRTSFAKDIESTRYALGGCLLEYEDDQLIVVASDGKRLARHTVDATLVGGSDGHKGLPFVASAVCLDTLLRLMKNRAEPVRFMADKTVMRVQVGDNTEVVASIVEGKFPQYRQMYKNLKAPLASPEFTASDLREAIDRASITTSETSYGVDFHFDSTGLNLSAEGADTGQSQVEMPMLAFAGPAVSVRLNPVYVNQYLASLPDDATVIVDVVGPKEMVHVRLKPDDDGPPRSDCLFCTIQNKD